jgi:hypothetical protein
LHGTHTQHPAPTLNPYPKVGVVVYWVAVAAVLYSAGVPTPHWRDADQFKPVGLQQLTLAGQPAPAMAARPNVTGLAGWVSGARVPCSAAALALGPSAWHPPLRRGHHHQLAAAPPRLLNPSTLAPHATRPTQPTLPPPCPTPHPQPPHPPQDLLDACAGSPDCYISYDWDARLKYAFIYHLFGLLWANQFIVGFSSVVVAGAVGSYYWARGDRSRRALGWGGWVEGRGAAAAAGAAGARGVGPH